MNLTIEESCPYDNDDFQLWIQKITRVHYKLNDKMKKPTLNEIMKQLKKPTVNEIINQLKSPENIELKKKLDKFFEN